MKKTIDLDEVDIQKVKEYQKKKGLKSFSSAIRSIIRSRSNDFSTLEDVLATIDKKVALLTNHLAPKDAGEVK